MSYTPADFPYGSTHVSECEAISLLVSPTQSTCCRYPIVPLVHDIPLLTSGPRRERLESEADGAKADRERYESEDGRRAILEG